MPRELVPEMHDILKLAGSDNMAEKETLILAALLHDIGKFWERTLNSDKEREASKFSAGKYKHSWWSALFAENFKRIFSELLFIQHLVQFHHNPEELPETVYTRFAKIIHIADRLSAVEREEAEEIMGRGKSETPLVCIFSQIELDKKKPEKFWYYPLSVISLKDKIFPDEDISISSSDYVKLWHDFEKELGRIKNKDDIFALYHLLKKYTSFTPSSTRKEEIPDVSLFDHLKTTAAISNCLFVDEVQEGFLDTLGVALTKHERKETLTGEEKNALYENRFLLVGGDICGIQKFIYNLTSKGAVKGLRGRSFYVQLLSETISTYLLSLLSLSICNLLYCEGGRFYVLAPLSAETNLDDISKEIGKKCLSLHQGEPYVILASLPLSPLDLSSERIGNKWEELNRKIIGRKKHKFSEVLAEQYEDLFVRLEEGGDKDFCQICGSEKDVQVEDEVSKCKECREFEKIARPIGEMLFWVETQEPTIKKEGFDYYEIAEFERYYYLLDSKDKLKELLKKLKEKEAVIYSVNSMNFLIEGNKNNEWNLGFKFVAKHTPFKNEDIKTFEDFAKESTGIKRWAALRMDVDNLGRIFSEGLKGRATISRLSTLSSMLSLYFNGYVENIVQDEVNKDKLYTIYSGGDDLFIVGSWNVIPEIAYRIYQNFRKFTCQNENVTLSGGIYIAPAEKFPLYKAAELAGEALDEKAKGFKDKDGLAFLEVPVKWHEFEEEVQIKDKIVECLNGKKVSRALLYSLMETIYTEHELAQKGKVPIWKIWKFFYMIKRFMERHKEAQIELLELENIFRPYFKDKPKLYGAAAIRWAEFLTRKEV